MNNQNKKPENLKPMDSEQKEINPKNDNQAVVKPEDKTYTKEEAHFKNPAKKREQSEQPDRKIGS